MLVDASSATSRGSIFDSGFFNSGGHFSHSVTRSSAQAWELIPVLGTGEGNERTGVGLARFQGGHFSQETSTRAFDGPAMAKSVVSQHVLCVIDKKKFEGKGNIGAVSATDSTLVGNLQFGLKWVSFSIPIVITTGAEATSQNESGILSSPQMEAGWVGLKRDTYHFVEIKADDPLGSASATEATDASEIDGIELDSKWK